ncbi:MAG: hypothetical protein Q7S39_04805 [Ignavibacteria bacterium]|nr:hypothetical protein [Ignavibacteria bacterium]
MGDFEQYNWISPDKKVSDLTTKEIVRINLLSIIFPYLTFITRYFPFSLLWQDRRFHYRFKDITEMDDFIIKTGSKKGFWFKLLSFERNENISIIIGKFIPVKKGANEDKLIKHFEKVFAKENTYISKPDPQTVKISFTNNLI